MWASVPTLRPFSFLKSIESHFLMQLQLTLVLYRCMQIHQLKLDKIMKKNAKSINDAMVESTLKQRNNDLTRN